jgi:hypothetical protein
MAEKFYVKTSPSGWNQVTNFFVKTAANSWSTVSEAYVKVSSTLWKLFYSSLMSPSQQVEIEYFFYGTNNDSYRLQGTNYKWTPAPQSLKYYFRQVVDNTTTYYIGPGGSSGTVTSNPTTSTKLPGVSTYVNIDPAGSNYSVGVLNSYNFEVRATGASGTVYPSISAAFEFRSPKAPTLSFQVNTSTSVTLTIAAASQNDYFATGRYILYTYDGTSGYVYSGGGRGGFSPTGSSMTKSLTGLVLGRTYTVYVLPITGSTGTSPSNYSGYPGVEAYLSSVTTGAGATSPTSITAANNGSATTVYISWSGASNASYYRVRWVGYQDTSVDPAIYYDKQITASSSTSGSWNWGPSDPDKDNAVPYSGVAYYYHVSSSADGTTWSPYTVSSTAVGTVQSYSVTWNGAGGSTGNEGIPWSFTAGGSVTAPSVSRIGYTFVRWTDTPSGDYTYTTTGGTFSPPSQNITMYARWQVNVCTIPNVIGMTEFNASNAVNNAGFLYEYTDYIDTTNASIVGTVAAIDPPVGSQPGCATNITLTLYRLSLKLPTPTGVNATDDRTDGSNITWNAVSGASYYGIWWGGQPSYDTGPDFGGPNNAGSWNGLGTSFLDTGITAGNTRTYYVQAYASGNPAGTKSDWSSPDVGGRAAPAVVITYGPCTTDGPPYYTTSGYDCYGTYSYAYIDYYYSQKRQILYNGTWTGSYDYSCPNTSVRSYGSYSQVNGQCGYSPPQTCISYKYQCKSYDITNSASSNYYVCFYPVGSCTATYNSDGSRATCCAAYG